MEVDSLSERQAENEEHKRGNSFKSGRGEKELKHGTVFERGSHVETEKVGIKINERMKKTKRQTRRIAGEDKKKAKQKEKPIYHV